MSEPSKSTLKARRRRVPNFDDEPVQWHLNSTRHDKCPWCGLAEMIYYTKINRSCENCHVTLDLTKTFISGKAFTSGKAWYEAKLNGYQSHYEGAPAYETVELEEWEEGSYDLKTAQRASSNGRASLPIKFGMDLIVVYWHRDGHVPEKKDGRRITAAGSKFWYWILDQRTRKVWEPDEHLNAMEILGRAATDDPVFAVVLSP